MLVVKILEIIQESVLDSLVIVMFSEFYWQDNFPDCFAREFNHLVGSCFNVGGKLLLY